MYNEYADAGGKLGDEPKEATARREDDHALVALSCYYSG